MKTKIILLILVNSLVSCGPSFYQHNQNEINNARQFWIGKTKHELIANWGSPNEKFNNVPNGEIYRYKRYNGVIIWVSDFYIDESGVIYNLNVYSE